MLQVVLARDLDLQITESGAIITHDDLPVIISDQDHLVQLLQNLIGNSIKYRRPEESTAHSYLIAFRGRLVLDVGA